MFGMVAATGARILTAVDFKTNQHNLLVVALSVGFGLIPLVAPTFFKNLPHELHPLLESRNPSFGGRCSAAQRILQRFGKHGHRARPSQGGRRDGRACVRR